MAQASDWTTVFIPKDGRTEVRHLDMVFTFPSYTTRASWESRAEYLRKRIFTSTSLLPMPEKCPLNVKVTEKIEGDDYDQLLRPFVIAIDYMKTGDVGILERLQVEEREIVLEIAKLRETK